jgi:hypothetical protein
VGVVPSQRLAEVANPTFEFAEQPDVLIGFLATEVAPSSRRKAASRYPSTIGSTSIEKSGSSNGARPIPTTCRRPAAPRKSFGGWWIGQSGDMSSSARSRFPFHISIQ